ncbi:stalk domain-containing protein [Paenibacillus sp. Leaf72]|uniref:stalk domain-containing protein n=1 Tax=Paenibacillus sp. Leaf72 TaxID=1736234 RepID=UPI0006F33146|nr:stalk domain-containing protein [Paenibacillus sp. Leaf72]KQN96009.1 hypothetical protein ASF12_24550 [Paenibacillus sp. Leaf72]
MKTKLAQTLLAPLLVTGLLLSPLAGTTSTASAASAVTTAASTTQAIKVYIDGSKLSLPAAPYVKNGVTFVPMRQIFTALGASITWVEKTQTIIVRKNTTTVSLTVGKKEAVVDGKTVKLDAAPAVKNGTTFVPARFVAEALGAKVKWDNAAQAVRITSIEQQWAEAYEEYEETPEDDRTKLTPKEIVEQNDESVVLITTNKALGSGVVIGDRWILTNNHVIEDASSATITSIYGDEYKVQGVVVNRPSSDLAIIQTDESLYLEPVSVGYTVPEKGDKVVAIGSPLGIQNTVSDGLVSNISYEDGLTYIQTSAPIDHGSSGGALFDEYGDLVGITTAGYTSQADLNFAVSVAHASLLMGLLPESPQEDVKFLPAILPDTLKGASMETITALMKKEFGSVATGDGTASFSNWEVKRDSQGWIVLTADIDPRFYTYYGGSSANDIRSWAINLGHELNRMLPGETIQVIISFDRTFGFQPRGFAENEVTALGDNKWKVRFPVLDMQLKDQLYISMKD